MAQGLTRRDSSGKVKRAARRHMRLARRTGNDAAISIANRIKTPLDDFKRVSAEGGDGVDAVEDAFDD